ncbi:DUF2231 domain-containing protein [Stakelama tenebrarum]|uniref:DUF2231 domain-containing protein n=1 Tax=Stakelama tenebrarum TaxID=2711215 RepID=A0A6G6Y384_9SPHN|nr:DUF2231 domain-containing protein [Sphingosinithalassobacter tenebrarum]QIG79359.1 hypothetical protein G5C33_05855 [Sphingosinithalassobacter tenebrarum]
MPANRFSFARTQPPHPVHAALLAGSLSLFLGALLSDWAYAATYQIQWTNFAAWLIAGALVFSGVAMLFAIWDVIRSAGRGLLYLLLLVATFLLGLVNALVHAKDAWAAMPAALILSVVVAVIAFAATWIGFAALRPAVSSEGDRA